MYSENEITALIIKEAIYVHQSLGPGLLESVYQNCLLHRLSQTGLQIERECPVPVIFESIKLECGYRADFIVENKIIVEIKAVEAINDIHKSQVLTYLRLKNLRFGLLINFNVVVLKDGIKRIVNGF